MSNKLVKPPFDQQAFNTQLFDTLRSQQIALDDLRARVKELEMRQQLMTPGNPALVRAS